MSLQAVPRHFLALLLGALTPAGAGAAEPLPYTVAVQVLQGPRRVPDAFVREVSRRIGEEIERRPCVRALVDEDEAPGIILRVILDDALEETRHALSIADRSQAQHQGADLDSVSTFEVRWQAEIAVPGTGGSARSKPSRAKAERQPAFPGEDAAAAARSDAARNIGKQARNFLCGGARKKLLQESGGSSPRKTAAPDTR